MKTLAFNAALFAVAYVGTYLLAVVQVRRKHAHEAYPRFEPRPLESMPRLVREKFKRELPGLEALGFAVVDYLHKAGLPKHESGRSDIFLALLKNEETGDLALLSEFFIQIKHVCRHVGLVSFTTDFADGSSVSTSNSSQVPVFKPDERRPSFRFPGVNDSRYLYQIHRALLNRHAPGRRGVLPTAGMEVPHLCEAEARTLRRQVECGYFYLDEASGLCVHTLKGALVMTGKQMYGIKNLLRASMKRRARMTLNSLGLRAA
jgi:hypothetical protein